LVAEAGGSVSAADAMARVVELALLKVLAIGRGDSGGDIVVVVQRRRRERCAP
jgi:hypothetical protein